MTAPRLTSRRELHPGFIFGIAREAGLDMRIRGDEKAILRCPFHDDSSPSAVLFASNVFLCSGCGLRLTAKEFSERLGLTWDPPLACARPPLNPSRKRSDPPWPPFTTEDAGRVWQLVLRRTRQDEPDPADRDVYAYLHRRGLAPAFDEDVYGILAADIALHPAIAHWPVSGHRLVSRLYASDGTPASLQARAIRAAERKLLFPAGSAIKGSVFANEAGLAVLKGAHDFEVPVALVEGLTDFLAMCTVTSTPVLGAPGAPFLPASVGPWVRRRTLFLAPDLDDAGEKVLAPTAACAAALGAVAAFRLRWPSDCRDAADTLLRHGPGGIKRAIQEAQTGARNARSQS
jgi:hypothetical protein